MIIDTSKLHTLWYENDKGERFVPDYDGGQEIPPQGFIYQHSRFPTVLKDDILRMVVREEVEKCEHPKDDVIPTGGWIDGMEDRECRCCKGTQVKSIDSEWSKTWDAEGSRPFMSGSSGWSEDLVLRMATRWGSSNPKYTLSESILISATACERCMNVLAHDHGLEWGYAEYSEDWETANTSCDFCK